MAPNFTPPGLHLLLLLLIKSQIPHFAEALTGFGARQTSVVFWYSYWKQGPFTNYCTSGEFLGCLTPTHQYLIHAIFHPLLRIRIPSDPTININQAIHLRETMERKEVGKEIWDVCPQM